MISIGHIPHTLTYYTVISLFIQILLNTTVDDAADITEQSSTN